MGVTIDTSTLEADILNGIKAALKVPLLTACQQVPWFIKDQAIFNNEDVDGQQMPPKQPRPKRNPRNFPELPLIDTGNLMDNGRWSVDASGELEVTITFDPPEYHQYLAEKGRDWIRPDAINDTARERIIERVIEELGGT